MTTVPEDRRDAAIEAYDVLRRPPRPELVSLAELAALLCGAPTASVNLITSREQHQVATVGLAASVAPREEALCATTVTLDGPVVVPDASRDVRLRDHPSVNGESGRVRFYASHQLTTPDGTVVGTLCVVDEEPRVLTPGQERALAGLAARVVDALELEVSTRRLATADERLAAFAGQVSHDLKNPLTAVTMSLEMAREEAAEVEGADLLVSLLDRSARGAVRMQTMIDDLLAYARGGSAPQVVDVDLSALVDQVLEDLRPHLGTAVVECGELATVPADPAQLRTVLHHLVANAVKFTRDGVEPHVVITAEDLGDHRRVQVTDNGRGIPEEKRGQVFEPFARIDKTVPGTGVGLATCRRIVEAHGGRIGLTGAPGGGSTVWFVLPAESGPTR